MKDIIRVFTAEMQCKTFLRFEPSFVLHNKNMYGPTQKTRDTVPSKHERWEGKMGKGWRCEKEERGNKEMATAFGVQRHTT